MAIIEVKEIAHGFSVGKKPLFKKREKRQVLENVSFSIEEGEIVGLTGANGVGKTTLIRILCGLLRPDEGSVRILDRAPRKTRKQLMKEIGVLLVNQTQLSDDIAVWEALEFNRRIFGTEAKVFSQKLEYYGKLLELTDVMERRINDLSLGQRRSLELLDVLMHNPKVLLLDEPTIGIDVTRKENIRNCLKQLNQTGAVTILLTSHDSRDIETLCNRVLRLEDGVVKEEKL